MIAIMTTFIDFSLAIHQSGARGIMILGCLKPKKVVAKNASKDIFNLSGLPFDAHSPVARPKVCLKIGRLIKIPGSITGLS